MSNWLRIVLAVVVGAHGIGHILFLMPLVSSTTWGQAARSWLLGDGGLAKGLGVLIWLVSLAGFVADGGDCVGGRFYCWPDFILEPADDIARCFRVSF